jgi:TolB-like protein
MGKRNSRSLRRVGSGHRVRAAKFGADLSLACPHTTSIGSGRGPGRDDMSDIFISYARSTEREAKAVAEALRAMGYSVWRDDELPPHRAYAQVIEERVKAAKVVVVIWSAEAIKSHWVRAEANAGLENGALVQLTLDGALPPMPFDQIHCVDLEGWRGEDEHPGWAKVAASVAELVGGPAPSFTAGPTDPRPLLDRPSIAVLPLANLSRNPDEEYFADGMTAEIVSAIARLGDLFIIAASSTLALKGKTTPPAEVGRTLGVRYLLEGSVRRTGERIRVVASLIEASTGAQIWTERFDDRLEDVFDLQDRIALKAANSIVHTVLDAEVRRVTRRPTSSLGSYDLYLRALYLTTSFDSADFLQALELLTQALELDPDNAQALGSAAIFHAVLAASLPPDEANVHVQEARRCAQRALAIDPNNPRVLGVSADALGQLRADRKVVESLVDRALELDPNLSIGWFTRGWLRISDGEFEGGADDVQNARRLDPLSSMRPLMLCWLGVAAYAQGHDGEAAALLTESHQLSPRYPLTLPYLAACHGQLGDRRSAAGDLSELKRSQGLSHTWVRRFLRHPAHAGRLQEGLAKAEGLALARPTDD